MSISRSSWKKLVIASAVALGSSFVGGRQAEAATATDSIAVTATVIATCTILAAPVAFGPYAVGVGSPNVDANGSVTINCSTGSPVFVTLGQGLPANVGAGSNDGAPNRQMGSGTDRLAYGLYSDAPGGVTWGNTQATGITTVGTGAVNVLTVYGRIRGGQSVPSGNYSDSVLATVNY